MEKKWSDRAWDEYQEYIANDKKELKKVNDLIKDIERNGNDGLGHPEPLKGDKSGFYSRQVSQENRLIYRVVNNIIEIAQCKGHYDDK